MHKLTITPLIRFTDVAQKKKRFTDKTVGCRLHSHQMLCRSTAQRKRVGHLGLLFIFQTKSLAMSDHQGFCQVLFGFFISSWTFRLRASYNVIIQHPDCSDIQIKFLRTDELCHNHYKRRAVFFPLPCLGTYFIKWKQKTLQMACCHAEGRLELQNASIGKSRTCQTDLTAWRDVVV